METEDQADAGNGYDDGDQPCDGEPRSFKQHTKEHHDQQRQEKVGKEQSCKANKPPGCWMQVRRDRGCKENAE